MIHQLLGWIRVEVERVRAMDLEDRDPSMGSGESVSHYGVVALIMSLAFLLAVLINTV